MTTYYHFTCDHAHARIGERGVLLPAYRLTDNPVPWTGLWVWLTNMPVPIRDALGLTSRFLTCDRIAHRYRVEDPLGLVLKWSEVARRAPLGVRDELESAPGARPAHWFVSPPIRAVYTPLVNPWSQS